MQRRRAGSGPPKRSSDLQDAPQFIALYQTSVVSPQSTLRGMAAMLCGLRYDEDNRLLLLEGGVG